MQILNIHYHYDIDTAFLLASDRDLPVSLMSIVSTACPLQPLTATQYMTHKSLDQR